MPLRATPMRTSIRTSLRRLPSTRQPHYHTLTARLLTSLTSLTSTSTSTTSLRLSPTTISQIRPLTTSPTLASSTTSPTPAPLTPETYNRLSETYIEALVERLETLAETRADVDVEYSAGVLTLAFPPTGTYVINKQPPNKQIWLSSPTSGPKRFDWVGIGEGEGDGAGEEGRGGRWVYLRDGTGLSELLETELGVDTSGLGREE